MTEDLKKLKADYEKARKKYALPKFTDLDKEFEIRRIDEPTFIIKGVRRAILNRIKSISSFFLPILDPNPQDLHSLIEMNALNNKDRGALFKFYKLLSYYLHKGITVSLISEKAEADFIKEVWKRWPDIKVKARKYMEKITDKWINGEKSKKEDIHYLG